MSSTISFAHSLMRQEEVLMRGARRSRFSFHLNTRHSRRWLLVQLVSLPAAEANEDLEVPEVQSRSTSHQSHRTLGQLLDNHTNTRFAYTGF